MAHDFAFIEIREKVGGVAIIPLLTTQEEWDEAIAPDMPVTVVGFGAVRDEAARLRAVGTVQPGSPDRPGTSGTVTTRPSDG